MPTVSRNKLAFTDTKFLREQLNDVSSLRVEGSVVSVTGPSVHLKLLAARVGDWVEIRRRGGMLPAEIVGFRDGEVVAMPLGELTGVGSAKTVAVRCAG